MEIYVSTDVETDGPIPGPNSMLSLGSLLPHYPTIRVADWLHARPQIDHGAARDTDSAAARGLALVEYDDGVASGHGMQRDRE